MHIERFAPSPTGDLHLGHAFSAITAWNAASRAGGHLVLRIEDIDRERSRPEYERAIIEDLRWLGITWKPPIARQSERIGLYEGALAKLTALGLCYPCCCTRRDIRQALAAPHGTSNNDDPIPSEPRCTSVYPGTCRSRLMSSRTDKDAIRLNIKRALEYLGKQRRIHGISFDEIGATFKGNHQLDPEWLLSSAGDVVLARKDVGTSYHLAVVVDDADQQVTHVTRGEDIFDFTQVHRLLQELLELPVPMWNHHRIISDSAGRRLAKRDRARSLRTYRASGCDPGSILDIIQDCL